MDFSTTTASALFTSMAQDVGVLLALSIGAVLITWAALVGLGYGIRLIVRKITGRKF